MDGLCGKEHNVMKRNMTVCTAVVVAAIASSALAPAASAAVYGQSQPANHQHSSNPAFDVYVNGEYIGSDPDPNIRAQLRRSHGTAGEW
jgi:hypothetical protein